MSISSGRILVSLNGDYEFTAENQTFMPEMNMRGIGVLGATKNL